jgi:hypothetical protein
MNPLMKTTNSPIIALAVLGLPHMASGQLAVSAPNTMTPVVFPHVNVVRMDRDRVEAGQTVVVQDGRIMAIGAVGQVPLPNRATVIDGTGRYLLPGLTDSHVHLEGWEGLRPDFGDAPLYLAYGVTTVINLRGTPTFFEWRRRIQAGELIGPTIYTAGEFLIGPRGPTLFRDSGERVVAPNVDTPDHVQSEILRQARQGVDVIKFYGGLPLPAYLKMAEAARAAGLPLVGHGPDNLGFDALLQARQPLAHVHSLLNLYFFPVFSNLRVLLATAGALAVLIVIVAVSATRGLLRGRQDSAPQQSRAVVRLLTVAGGSSLASVLAVWVQTGVFPFDALESTTSFILVVVCAVVVSAQAIALLLLAVRACRDRRTPTSARMPALLAASAGITLACLLAVFWAPVSWRATDSGIESMAKSLREAEVSVVSTLLPFTSGPERMRLASDPAMDHLPPTFRDRWRRIAALPGPSPRVPEFLKKVTRALHQAGVPLTAGTDALGAPLMIPGVSLHYELRLLTDSGLTPYEAIRSATVNPAVFLRKEQDFGTIAVGRRADLLLVERNPLQDLTTLKEPIGVMVRGNWLTHDQLQRMLRTLVARGRQ